MPINFSVEFLVPGTPVSLQTRRAEAKTAWQARVRDAWVSGGEPATEGRVAATLFYFPDEEMEGDIDNIVKPILDALGSHVYIDDHQVERVLVQKFEPGNVFRFGAPSETLQRALAEPKPLLYVRLSDNPHDELA